LQGIIPQSYFSENTMEQHFTKILQIS